MRSSANICIRESKTRKINLEFRLKFVMIISHDGSTSRAKISQVFRQNPRYWHIAAVDGEE